MKNISLSIFLFIILTSCEEDIVYEFATTSISSSDYELCAYDHCPDLILNYIEFNKPEALAEVVNKEVQNLLIEQLTFDGQTASSVKEAVELYLSNSENSYPEDSVFSAVHELQMDIEVHYSSNDVVTLQSDYFEFAGGAHGRSGVHYWNYNPKTGKRLENEALFKDIEGFTAFAKAQFIQTHGPLDQFWFEEEVFMLPASMGFSQEGMLLFYNVYEIAPYADGTFQLIVPWEEVEEYLNF